MNPDSLFADSLAQVQAAADTLVQHLAPTAPPTPLETVMLQQDKLYVVAAVLFLIWLGVLALLYRNDRRLDRLERALEARAGADRP